LIADGQSRPKYDEMLNAGRPPQEVPLRPIHLYGIGTVPRINSYNKEIRTGVSICSQMNSYKNEKKTDEHERKNDKDKIRNNGIVNRCATLID